VAGLVLVVLLVLRKPIAELLPKLRSWEGPAGKFDFGKQLAETEESVDEAVEAAEQTAASQTEIAGSAASLAPPPPALEPSLDAEANANPSFVVLSAWERLVAALADLVGAAGLPMRSRTVVAQVDDLRRRGVVNEDFLEAVTELRQLRNAVAHGQHNPTAGEALAYAESAEELRRAAHLLADMTARRRRPGESPATDE
jgi:hypothetical protein